MSGKAIHPDHLNSPRRVYDASQQLVWAWENQEPFGDSPADENPSALGAFEFPLRDEGTYADKETNLVYNLNRYRDPSIGRFPQADPLGLACGDLSLYVLRRNNPLSYTDPTGEAVPAAAALPLCVANPIACGVVVAGGLILASPGGQQLVGAIGNTISNALKQSCDDDDRCERAKSDARWIYNDLKNRRIPQYISGGTRGPDPGHLRAIQQKQVALRDAIRRVRLYCNPLPAELPDWEEVANRNVQPRP